MDAERASVIYAWVCPKTGAPVYVGKTSMSLERRTYNHKRCSTVKPKTKKEYWLRDILALGLSPRVVVLAKCSVERSSGVERRWVRRLRERFDLLNTSTAGAGNPGVGRVKWTEDLIAMLGKVPDSTIAKMIGCERKTVSYRRECLGIKASFDRANNVPPPNMGGWNKISLPDHIAARLGLESDRTLAAEMGIGKSVIARHRKILGIKTFAILSGKSGRFAKGDPHPRWSRPQKESQP